MEVTLSFIPCQQCFLRFFPSKKKEHVPCKCFVYVMRISFSSNLSHTFLKCTTPCVCNWSYKNWRFPSCVWVLRMLNPYTITRSHNGYLKTENYSQSNKVSWRLHCKTIMNSTIVAKNVQSISSGCEMYCKFRKTHKTI